LALAWCFEDEGTDEVWALFVLLMRRGVAVPGHWRLEVASGLVAAERRRRVRSERVEEFLAVLRRLPLQVDPDTDARAHGPILARARRDRLSAYDATYLDLALRVGAPLATLDGGLRGAATAAGIDVVP
jgi:predicted nucleic acid-binding protein